METDILNILQSGILLRARGYEVVTESQLVCNLRQVQPGGGTAFRDAASIGTQLILNLATQLIERKIGQLYHFVHVLMTDGEDTHSKTSFEDLMQLNFLLGKLIPAKMLTTYYIGVGLNPNNTSTQELFQLAEIGDNSKFLQSTAENISNIFNQIQVELGINQSHFIGAANLQGSNPILFGGVTNELVMNLKEKKYIVLFNLDISGSMKDNQQWTRVVGSVQNFVDHLSKTNPDSFVNAYLFNESIINHHDFQAQNNNLSQNNQNQNTNLGRLPTLNQIPPPPPQPQQSQPVYNTPNRYLPQPVQGQPVYNPAPRQHPQQQVQLYYNHPQTNQYNYYNQNGVPAPNNRPLNPDDEDLEGEGQPFLGFIGGLLIGLWLLIIYYCNYKPHNRNTKRGIQIGTAINCGFFLLIIILAISRK